MYFDDVETGQGDWSGSGAQGMRADRLGGVRLEGGVSLVQIAVRNVGTSNTDAKGEAQVGSPHEGQSTEAASRDGVGLPRFRGQVR